MNTDKFVENKGKISDLDVLVNQNSFDKKINIRIILINKISKKIQMIWKKLQTKLKNIIYQIVILMKIKKIILIKN